MNTLISIISLTVLLSCVSCSDCNYKITSEYVESACKFETGIFFEKLIVDSLDMKGLPIKYTAEHTIVISKTDPNLKSTKRIYFYSKTVNYQWIDIEKSTTYANLPYKMEADNWYLFRGLMKLGNPNQLIFIHVDENMNHKFYFSDRKTSW